jgi:hypothetical protein
MDRYVMMYRDEDVEVDFYVRGSRLCSEVGWWWLFTWAAREIFGEAVDG